MQIDLFPDQQNSIDRLRAELSRYKSVILQGETGSGKSVMASYMIQGSLKKGLKCAFIVPRKDLLFQMTKTFSKFGIEHSYVADKYPFNPYANMHLCSLGTLINRIDRISPQVVFVDECHYSSEMLGRIINCYKASGAWVIGLSATPELPNGKGLGAYYDRLVEGPNIRELINLKRLSDYRLFSPSRPDLSKIKMVAGDYAQGELADYMENNSLLIGDAVRDYKNVANGLLNVTFCTSIKHSEMTAQAFNDAGIPSAHMDGKTPDIERRNIARAFANRELLNICSVDLLTFGYDLAAASGNDNAVIESMSDLNPTKSRTKQRQKNGRVLRYKDRPAIINDHSLNAITLDGMENHGFPCKIIEWDLTGKPKKRTRESTERDVDIRQCPKCFFVHKPNPTCTNCGFIYPVKSRVLDEIDGELKEIDPKMILLKKKQEQGRKKTLDELIAIGKARKMSNPFGWAQHVFNARKNK